MRKALLTVTLIGLAAGTQAQAAESASREEMVGVGGGAVIGAMAGGPPGFIIGAAIGAALGDRLHSKEQDIRMLESSLDERDERLGRLQSAIGDATTVNDALGDEIRRLRDLARPELVELMQAGIAMDLLFHTDETALPDMTGARLAELAAMLGAMQDVRIELDGFADERGDADYNLKLSEQRVDFVRDQLVAAGVPANHISSSAHGESIAQEATPDSFALERRVTLKLVLADGERLASNP